MGIPGIIGSLVEIPLGIAADVWPRRLFVAGGGAAFALALCLVGAAPAFVALLAGLMLFNPASGAFVSLSQATLMDLAPERREYNMARWALAGSLGNLAGPMLAGAALAAGAGWRPLFFGLAVLAVVAGLAAWVSWRTSAVYGESSPAGKAGVGEGLEFGDSGGPDAVAQCQDAGRASVGPLAELRRGLYGAVFALRDGKVVRWLIALQFSDLMLDVFRGYVALYLVEVAGTSQEMSGLAVGILTGASLVGNAVLVRVLRRVSGLNYLRFSLVGVVAVYPLFLLWAGVIPKMAVLVLVGLLTSGWYPVLKAQLYAALPRQSGTALALSNVAGLAGALLPLSLGLASESLGLQRSMWLLLAGPLVVALSLRGWAPHAERGPMPDKGNRPAEQNACSD